MSTTSRTAPDRRRPAVSSDPDDRLNALDILRGLALFGMILVHFHQKMRLEATGVEDLIGWAVWILVEQKAWGTFAFLFGAGFAILLDRLETRGQPVVATYLRRLVALAAFGIIAEVGFGFHILFSYACWGVALLLVRRWSTRALLVTAALAAAARSLVALGSGLWAMGTATPLPPPASLALGQAAAAAAEHGGYGVLLAARWQLFLATTPGGWRGLLPDSNLALFIVGLLAIRYRVLQEPRRHTRLIAGWMSFGALSWLCSWVILRRLPPLAVPGAGWIVEFGMGLIQDQWLAFTYIGAVVLLLAFRPIWTSRLKAIGQAGRMALTNYMAQAVALDLLSSGYGVGLRLRPYLYAAASVLLFSMVAGLSSLWLTRFRYGPLEWIWRMVTYARRQPIRRPAG